MSHLTAYTKKGASRLALLRRGGICCRVHYIIAFGGRPHEALAFRNHDGNGVAMPKTAAPGCGATCLAMGTWPIAQKSHRKLDTKTAFCLFFALLHPPKFGYIFRFLWWFCTATFCCSNTFSLGLFCCFCSPHALFEISSKCSVVKWARAWKLTPATCTAEADLTCSALLCRCILDLLRTLTLLRSRSGWSRLDFHRRLRGGGRLTFGWGCDLPQSRDLWSSLEWWRSQCRGRLLLWRSHDFLRRL